MCVFNIFFVLQNNVFCRCWVVCLNGIIVDYVVVKGYCWFFDMGGMIGFWCVWCDEFDFVNLIVICVNFVDVKQEEMGDFFVIVCVGNVCVMLEFEDNVFDVVFFNLVIEYVGFWLNKVVFVCEV